jgi:hypothetical protein
MSSLNLKLNQETQITLGVPRTKIAISLRNASEYLSTLLGPKCKHHLRDYHDHKSAQLLCAIADLLIAEAQIESWRADIGFNGCQEDSSTGGVACHTMCQEI